MKIVVCITSVFSYLFLSGILFAATGDTLRNELVRAPLAPVRIVWQSGDISNEKHLLVKGDGQADLSNRYKTIFKNKGDTGKAAILLDFGKEIHGYVELITGMWPGDNKPIKVRIRYGESVGEAMSDIGNKGASNDHAIRDISTLLPWLGKIQLGETGFRFVRIDVEDTATELHIKEVRAVAVYRDIPYLGSFKSSDKRLDSIWQTGAYTVHLNMQNYLWDGIKRDRLVWVGDLHPEVATINAVFGYNEVVPKSLDLARDQTPLPGWMNGISTYSMWWIILQDDWYRNQGDLSYLKEQRQYLSSLVKHIVLHIGDDNKEKMNGTRFLDWPSSENVPAVHAGLQAMTVWSLSVASRLAGIIGDTETGELASDAVARLKGYMPDANGSKQAAALMAIAGIMPPVEANNHISVDGAARFSTFYGYYMLEAKAKAGDYQGAIDVIREFWGGMLDLGATSFWEDFNLDWIPQAARIDELVTPNKRDIHGDYGAYCYAGYRHSLCHGWASGPTAWLTEHVLGIKVIAPGCKVIRITPHLGDLSFAEGTFPTPYGVLTVKHTKQPDGKIKSSIKVPKGVKIIK